MKIFTFVLVSVICSLVNGQPAPDRSVELTIPGSGKLLADWIDVHLGVVKTTTRITHHTRELAYSGIALYESLVGGTTEYQSISDKLNEYPGTPVPPGKKDICWLASANEALATSFRHFYADNQSAQKRVDSMEQAAVKSFADLGYSNEAITAGAEYGKQVAMKVIEWCKSDGSDKSQAAYTVPVGEGYWEPTPPAFRPPVTPYMGNERTLIQGSIDNTLPPPPTAFSKEAGSGFYNMVDEVYRNSLEKNDSNTALALHWDDFPDGKTMTSGGHWGSILRIIIQQNKLSLMEAASAYAALYIAMHDAVIGCFKAKYTYNVMRPVTYVHKYMNHQDWNPLITTPSHPEYPAAHATVSMAAATVLSNILGEEIAFTDNTYKYRNYPERRFMNLKEAGKEAGMSRFYGGIHYKPSIRAGAEQGEKIASNVSRALVFRKQLTER